MNVNGCNLARCGMVLPTCDNCIASYDVSNSVIFYILIRQQKKKKDFFNAIKTLVFLGGTKADLQ